MKMLPLWSGIMIPIFGYGDDISSSAAVESSFKKLKTITMKHVTLPTKIEIFLEDHIMSLKGASLLREASNNNYNTEIVEENNYINNKASPPTDMIGFIEDTTIIQRRLSSSDSDAFTSEKVTNLRSPSSSIPIPIEAHDITQKHVRKNTHNLSVSKCPLCITGIIVLIF